MLNNQQNRLLDKLEKEIEACLTSIRQKRALLAKMSDMGDYRSNLTIIACNAMSLTSTGSKLTYWAMAFLASKEMDSRDCSTKQTAKKPARKGIHARR